MKKFILCILLLLGSLGFARQKVVARFCAFSMLDRAERQCNDLINLGYTIVSVAMYEYGYLIVYEDNE